MDRMILALNNDHGLNVSATKLVCKLSFKQLLREICTSKPWADF